jgi:hypothetical protein
MMSKKTSNKTTVLKKYEPVEPSQEWREFNPKSPFQTEPERYEKDNSTRRVKPFIKSLAKFLIIVLMEVGINIIIWITLVCASHPYHSHLDSEPDVWSLSPFDHSYLSYIFIAANIVVWSITYLTSDDSNNSNDEDNDG